MRTTEAFNAMDEVTLQLELADVFAGESQEDIPERWDIYTYQLPSGAKSVFLFAPESGKLEIDEAPMAWDCHNAGCSWETETEARDLAGEIMFRVHTKRAHLEYYPPDVIRILTVSRPGQLDPRQEPWGEN